MANKNALRVSVVGALDQTADYVEYTAGNNEVKLTSSVTSSGFGLANTGHGTAVPGMTAILSVTNPASTKLELELQVADNAWCYLIQTRTAAGAWTTALVVTNPHDAVLTNLVPGTNCDIRACTMGSGNQTSDWCDVVSHIST